MELRGYFVKQVNSGKRKIVDLEKNMNGPDQRPAQQWKEKKEGRWICCPPWASAQLEAEEVGDSVAGSRAVSWDG